MRKKQLKTYEDYQEQVMDVKNEKWKKKNNRM